MKDNKDTHSKMTLVKEIERNRRELNQHIGKEDYEKVLRLSQELDSLIELYIVSGF